MDKNIIPKIIHYVWLSGEEKPQMIQDCIASWKSTMPDFEIKEWGMADIKDIDSSFLRGAINFQKWAFATDYLRFYIIYNYGGIYMDSDVYVYRSLSPFLIHRGFSCIELWPNQYLRTALKKNPKGIGIEAAIFGAEKYSGWIKHILDFYANLEFYNTPSFYTKISAPSVMRKGSIAFGFRDLPLFQVLQDDIYIYPPDTFSSCDYRLYLKNKDEYKQLGEQNEFKYACHLCNNSWGYVIPKSFLARFTFFLKRIIISLLGESIVKKIKRCVR